MLSFTFNTLKPFTHITISTTSTSPKPSSSSLSLKPISASKQPWQTQQKPPNQQVYQPFRPPPSPIPPQYQSLDAAGRLDILANRLGAWHEYAPLISALIQDGFTPPTIEEITGINGVEQNCLVVAAQVRDSLIQAETDPEILREFDTSGSELLYEIRLLSVQQRAAAARFIVEKKLDCKGANDLARATKDFVRRRSEKGWESFDYSEPGDCLGFMYYRQARENREGSELRNSMLEGALKVVGSESARNVIVKELDGLSGEEEEEGGSVAAVGVKVAVVRLKFGEVAESNRVVIMPVCKGEEEVMEAPWECRREGEFGVVAADKGWKRWVVLPGWEPVVGLGEGGGGVVVEFADARVLPWKVNRWYKEEPILVVTDRTRKEVEADDGFYLAAVEGEGLGFKVERGSELKEAGVEESLGTVVLIVRPPKDDNEDQLAEEEWE